VLGARRACLAVRAEESIEVVGQAVGHAVEGSVGAVEWFVSVAVLDDRRELVFEGAAVVEGAADLAE
jgi:hypothetical protein